MPRLKLGERDGRVTLLIGFTHDELKAIKNSNHAELPVPEALFTFTDEWGTHDIKGLYFLARKDDDSLVQAFRSLVLRHEKTQRTGGEDGNGPENL